MSTSEDARLLALEELTAHQAMTIEELSSEINRQGGLLQRTQKTLETLAKRLVALEEAGPGDVPVDRPPHW